MPGIIRIIFAFMLLATATVAQEAKVAKIKVAYLFRFAENTIWSDEDNLSTFKIGVYGDAPEVFGELNLFRKTYRLKGLPVEVVQIKSLNNLEEIQMLYQPSPGCDQIKETLNEAQIKSILLVSDQCENVDFGMINFLFSRGKIQFEVNTTHIKSAGLGLNPELLLLVGDESGALEAFNESEKSLQSEKQRVDQLKTELTEIRQELQKQKGKYDEQLVLLNEQKEEMKMLSDSIDYQQNRYARLQSGIKNQALTIETQQAILDQKLQEIDSQSKAFDLNQRLLTEQSATLEHQLKLIDEHESQIDKQVAIIEWQKYGLFLAIFILSLVAGIIFSIIKNSRIKRRAFALLQAKNKELLDNKNEISVQNEALKKQREELMEMTEALQARSNELHVSIAEVERANAEISEINENLEETVRQRTEELRLQHEKILNYLSHNSHIVRGPLSRILGLTNLFNSIKPEEAAELLDDITHAAEEVDKVVNEINGVLQSEREKF